jgi:hypothetical protein
VQLAKYPWIFALSLLAGCRTGTDLRPFGAASGQLQSLAVSAADGDIEGQTEGTVGLRAAPTLSLEAGVAALTTYSTRLAALFNGRTPTSLEGDTSSLSEGRSRRMSAATAELEAALDELFNQLAGLPEAPEAAALALTNWQARTAAEEPAALLEQAQPELEAIIEALLAPHEQRRAPLARRVEAVPLDPATESGLVVAALERSIAERKQRLFQLTQELAREQSSERNSRAGRFLKENGQRPGMNPDRELTQAVLELAVLEPYVERLRSDTAAPESAAVAPESPEPVDPVTALPRLARALRAWQGVHGDLASALRERRDPDLGALESALAQP